MRAVSLSIVLLTAAAAPALATPCAEHIATIERRLNSEGGVAVTGTTTSGRVETGSPKALPTPPAGQPSTGDMGPTPERIAQARALMEKARDFDRKGDNAACNDAMTQAKLLIGPLP